jgi:hypothetical protein
MNIWTNESIGTVTFCDDNKITLSHPATKTVLTYKNTLKLPGFFTTFNGNDIFWRLIACNNWQLTMYGEITNGVVHDEEVDVAIAVILDSKLKKGRIEFRKAVTQEEIELLLLSFLGGIEVSKLMIKNGSNTAVSTTEAR